MGGRVRGSELVLVLGKLARCFVRYIVVGRYFNGKKTLILTIGQEFCIPSAVSHMKRRPIVMLIIFRDSLSITCFWNGIDRASLIYKVT